MSSFLQHCSLLLSICVCFDNDCNIFGQILCFQHEIEIPSNRHLQSDCLTSNCVLVIWIYLAIFVTGKHKNSQLDSRCDNFNLCCDYIDFLLQNNYGIASPSVTNPKAMCSALVARRKSSVPFWAKQNVSEQNHLNILPSTCLLSSVLYCCHSYNGNG